MDTAAPQSALGVREAADWGPPFSLFVLFRAGHLERSDPSLFGQAAQDLFEVLQPMLRREGMVEVSHRSGYLFTNGRRLSVDFTAFHATRFLVEVFNRHHLGGIRFLPQVSLGSLQRLVRIMGGQGRERHQELTRMLTNAGVEGVVLLVEGNAGVDPLAIKPRDLARRTVETQFRSLFITKRILGAIRPWEGVDGRLAKRIIHGIVDLLLEERESLVALTELKASGGTLFDHSLNVAILSVLTGQQMGLPRRLLGSLGSAGLFHDFGLVGLPEHLPKDIRSWDRADKQKLRGHPVEGFLAMLTGRTLTDQALRNAIVAWEHHLRPDGEGSQACSREPLRPTLLSRIVAVADTFEVLCSVGSDGSPLTTREAIEQLRGPLAEYYDQTAVEALAAALL